MNQVAHSLHFHSIFLNALHRKKIIIKKIYTLKCETRSNTFFFKKKEKKFIYSMLLDFCTLACFTHKKNFFSSFRIFFRFVETSFRFHVHVQWRLEFRSAISRNKKKIFWIEMPQKFQLATIKIFLFNSFLRLCENFLPFLYHVSLFFFYDCFCCCIMNEQLMTTVVSRIFNNSLKKI